MLKIPGADQLGASRNDAGTSDPVLRILHLEDDASDARLVREMLREGGVAADVTTVATRGDFVAALDHGGFDLILADFRLPTFDGMEALALARSRGEDLPFIFVTGAMGEERAIETLKGGATDYVLKGNLHRMAPAVRRAVDEAESRSRGRRAEEEIQRQRQAFQRLAENSPDIIARFDRRCRYVYINPAIERVTGRPSASVLGCTNEELGIPQESCMRFNQALGRVFQEGLSQTMEFNFPGFDGLKHSYHVLVVPELSPDGLVETALSVARDVTELKESGEALRQANLALARADKHKDEFLAMLAHELRNPLAPIRYVVQGLRGTKVDPAYLHRQCDVIDRQVTHMSRLLDDLLDVSRVTHGRITLEKIPLDLRDVVDSALDACRPVLQERRLKLFHSAFHQKLPVRGDPTRLDQIVRNLLNNAAKFTPQGGEVHVSLGREEATRTSLPQAVLRVRDTGTGIAPEMLPRIFELFTQADTTLDRAEGGLGIGLTMVKRLAEIHGGTVLADSEGTGRGSEFIIRLPLLATPEPKAPPLPEQTRPEGNSGVRIPQAPLRVLIIEDNVDSADSLARLLRLWGHVAEVTHDGASALRLSETAAFDLVLVDIGLPGANGFEVARRLRASDRNARSCIVAVTGYGQEEHRVESKSAGIDHHLTKPIDLRRLEALLAGVPRPAAGERPAQAGLAPHADS